MENASSTTIKSITARAVIVPMANPHQTASGTIAESPLVIIDVVTSDGNTGHGIVFTYTRSALKPTADFINNLKSLIVDEKLSPLDITAKLNKRFRLLGTQGLVGMALAGIDMAVWDALARKCNLPLVTLLGGCVRQIPAYGAIGYDGAAGSARVAEQWAQQGFKGVKAKIGYPTIWEDVEVVRAIRSAVGDEVAIMVDYNQSLTPTEAIQRLSLLESEGLEWIEEPTLAHDYLSHAKIAKEIRTPIQCGENWWGVQDMQHAINAGASDYIMLDVMKIGGVTGWMKGAAIADANNIEISNHLWPELSARLLCCAAMAPWLEYCDWWNPILKNPLSLQNGNAVVDNSIGSGIEWNESTVQEYLV